MSRNPKRSRSWRAHSAVYIVEAPENFRPQRPWSVPDEFTSARLHSKNLFLDDARQFVATFNKAQVQAVCRHDWDGTWAIVVPSVRRNHHAAATREGGAT